MENGEKTIASSKESLLEEAKHVTYVGPKHKTVALDDDWLQKHHHLKQDLVRMIVQWLEDEGYVQSPTVLQDEADVKHRTRLHRRGLASLMRKSILEGDWTEVDQLCTRNEFRGYSSFLYAVHVQQYLELVENHDLQKALNLLTRKIKPLENAAPPGEFHDLCFLLSCSSLQESPAYKTWEGAGPAREKLVSKFESLLEAENHLRETEVPPHRLEALLKQAVQYQIEFCAYRPTTAPNIETLLRDFRPQTMPNAAKAFLKGHRANVKCVTFIGSEGLSVASGSSDNTVMVWDTATGKPLSTLEGHASRIWDLSSNQGGTFVASASADKTVKIWSVSGHYQEECTLVGHTNDVYAVRVHPGQNHVVSGGYDRVVRLFDIRDEKCVKTLAGHELAVSCVAFNPYGNLAVSGSKDYSVRLWDLASGLCIKSLSAHFEVTSVEINEEGSSMIMACKDNSNHLWDLRMMRPIKRFHGHQNTSKNFIRTSFGPTRHLVTGGSEDGCIPMWDTVTGQLVQSLPGHRGAAYTAVSCPSQGLLASCGDDGLVALWWYDDSLPLVANEKS